MSESTEYTQQLESLITKTLLPVYEKHCRDNGLNIYESGIPIALIHTLQLRAKPLAALLREKQSGCSASDPEPPSGKKQLKQP
jgi:hypothetical protein